MIDKRIKRHLHCLASTAQKTKQYDMYKRFIRWASDRLDDDGIIAFVTNRAYSGLHDRTTASERLLLRSSLTSTCWTWAQTFALTQRSQVRHTMCLAFKPA